MKQSGRFFTLTGGKIPVPLPFLWRLPFLPSDSFGLLNKTPVVMAISPEDVKFY